MRYQYVRAKHHYRHTNANTNENHSHIALHNNLKTIDNSLLIGYLYETKWCGVNTNNFIMVQSVY